MNRWRIELSNGGSWDWCGIAEIDENTGCLVLYKIETVDGVRTYKNRKWFSSHAWLVATEITDSEG